MNMIHIHRIPMSIGDRPNMISRFLLNQGKIEIRQRSGMMNNYCINFSFSADCIDPFQCLQRTFL